MRHTHTMPQRLGQRARPLIKPICMDERREGLATQHHERIGADGLEDLVGVVAEDGDLGGEGLQSLFEGRDALG